MSDAPAPNRLYFRQLLAGRDFARNDPMARLMVNFVYLIGDRETGEAVVIDPAYDIAGILDVVAADDMRLVGALATHYHADHVGGHIFGHDIQGVHELLAATSVPVHVQSEEAEFILKQTELSETDLVKHSSGDVVMVGGIPIELIHTPGHTPGSQCFMLDGALVSGDTLFLEGCAAPTCPVVIPSRSTRASPSDWRRCPMTRCCSRAISIRRTPTTRWATPVR